MAFVLIVWISNEIRADVLFCWYDSAYSLMCMNTQHTFIIYVVYISGFYFNHQDTSYLIFICSCGGAPLFCQLIGWQWYRTRTLTARIMLSLFLFLNHYCFYFFCLSLEFPLLIQCIMYYASAQQSILSLALVKFAWFSTAVVLNLSRLILWFKPY